MTGAHRSAGLRGSHRTDVNGWIRLHLEGTPREMGYSHGYLLANEIAEAVRFSKAYVKHVYDRPWSFFRTSADELYIPKLPHDQKEEMKGILGGLRERSIRNLDLTDVAINGLLDTFSYHYWLEGSKKNQ